MTPQEKEMLLRLKIKLSCYRLMVNTNILREIAPEQSYLRSDKLSEISRLISNSTDGISEIYGYTNQYNEIFRKHLSESEVSFIIDSCFMVEKEISRIVLKELKGELK
jgi:hypothetical protein